MVISVGSVGLGSVMAFTDNQIIVFQINDFGSDLFKFAWRRVLCGNRSCSLARIALAADTELQIQCNRDSPPGQLDR